MTRLLARLLAIICRRRQAPDAAPVDRRGRVLRPADLSGFLEA